MRLSVKKLSNKKEIVFVFIMIILLGIVNCFAFVTQVNAKQYFSSGIKWMEREETIFTNTFTGSDDVLVQNFVPQKGHIDSIQILLAISDGLPSIANWKLKIELRGANSEVIQQAIVGESEFENWDYYTFKVDKDVKTGEE